MNDEDNLSYVKKFFGLGGKRKASIRSTSSFNSFTENSENSNNENSDNSIDAFDAFKSLQSSLDMEYRLKESKEREEKERKQDFYDRIQKLFQYESSDEYINYLLRYYDGNIVQIIHDVYNNKISEEFSSKAIILDDNIDYIYKKKLIKKEKTPSVMTLYDITDLDKINGISKEEVINILYNKNLIATKEEQQVYALYNPNCYVQIRDLHDIDFCIQFIQTYPYEYYVLRTDYKVKTSEAFNKEVNKLKLENKFIKFDENN